MLRVSRRPRAHRPLALHALVLIAFVLPLLAACERATVRRIEFTQPIGSVVLGADQDASPEEPGVQYGLRLLAQGIAEGTKVSLLRRLESAESFETIAESEVAGDGSVVFASITFGNGTFILKAQLTDGDLESGEVTVQAALGCESLRFVEPLETGEPIVLNAAANTSDAACASSFTIDVQLRSGLPTGTALSLLMNGTEIGNQATNGALVTFANVEIPTEVSADPASLSVVATLEDAVCTLELASTLRADCGLPELLIVSPSEGSVLTAGNDCDAVTSGVQVEVLADTDAPDDSAATVALAGGGSVTTTAQGGQISACVDAGASFEQQATVTVTGPTGGVAEVSRVFNLLSSEPLGAVAALLVNLEARRDGLARMTFNAVSADGAGGEPYASYELRCTEGTTLADETAWEESTTRVTFTSGLDVGLQVSGEVSELWTGQTYACAVRGTDVGGQLGPITDVSFTEAFLVTTLQLGTGSTSPDGAGEQFGHRVTTLGDINDDGFLDYGVITDAPHGAGVFYEAWILLGTADGLLGTAPGGTPPGLVHITSTIPRNLASQEALTRVHLESAGDFNGDGVDDFALAIALSGAATFRGKVYVVLGHDSGAPAPFVDGGIVDLGDGLTCPVDLCFTHSETASLLGFNHGFSPAFDFDGDGLDDLAVGARLYDQAYVMLGRADGDFVAGTNYLLYPAAPGGPGLRADEANGFVINATASCLPGSFGTSGQENSCAFGESVTGMPPVTSGGPSFLVVGESGVEPPAPAASRDGRVWTIAGRSYVGHTGGDGLEYIDVDAALAAVPPTAAEHFINQDFRGTWARALRNVGDFDGDGITDLGGWASTGEGEPFLAFGDASSVLSSPELRVANDSPGFGGDLFGQSMAAGWHPSQGTALSDLNGDGRSEVLMSSTEEGLGVDPDGAGPMEAPDLEEGTVAIYYGRASRPVTLTRLSASFRLGRGAATDGVLDPITGTERGIGDGLLVGAFVGDVSGDGVNDILLGDPETDSDTGAVRVIY